MNGWVLMIGMVVMGCGLVALAAAMVAGWANAQHERLAWAAQERGR